MNYNTERNITKKYTKLIETFPEWSRVGNIHQGINNVRMYENIDENIIFMCEECYSLIPARIYKNMDILLEPKISERMRLEIYCKPSIFVDICPFCYNIDVKLIELDYNIAHPIQLLNKKGYKTLFSCEGHLKNSECFPYIYFESRDVLKYTDSLGDSWWLDLDQLKYTGCVIIRSNWAENYNDKLEYMIELLEWVKSLPYNNTKEDVN